MRTLLVCAAMRDQDGCDAAVRLLEAKKKEGVRVVSGLAPPSEGGINWPEVRNAEGGWEGAYAWAARAHDGFCLVPIDGDTGLSRGVYSIAMEALRLGKQVMAARTLFSGVGDGPMRLFRVASLQIVNPGEYKGVYGRLVLPAEHRVVYFAHSMLDYGSERAAAARDLIRANWKGFRLLDPEKMDWGKEARRLGSFETVYDYVINAATEVVVLERDGHVGKGVYSEVRRALALVKPTWALRKKVSGSPVEVRFYRARVHRVDLVDESDWKLRYGRLLVASTCDALEG